MAFGTAATELVLWDRAAGSYTYEGGLLEAVRGGGGEASGRGRADVAQFRAELVRVEAELGDWQARREAVRASPVDNEEERGER